MRWQCFGRVQWILEYRRMGKRERSEESREEVGAYELRGKSDRIEL